MSIGHSFYDKLTSMYESFKNRDANITNLISELAYYESIIPVFFSQNGEADSIRNMYKNIHESIENGNEPIVECVDVNKSYLIYLEYVDGMIKFINEVKNITDLDGNNVKLEEYSDKFNRAKRNDSLFIESLYNGRLSEISGTKVSDAVCNIEFLIDFIPNMKSLKMECISLQDDIESIQDSTKHELLDNCLSMLYESVNTFSYNTIKNVVSTYYSIIESLENEDGDNMDKHNLTTEYKLF